MDDADMADLEGPHGEEPRIWTRYDIMYRGGLKPYTVIMETNDDNDDGFAEETVHAEYTFKTLDDAIAFTGGSRVGFAGHVVEVTGPDGKHATQEAAEAAKERQRRGS